MAYTLGECTYGAWMLAQWLPTNLGNADTWVSRAAADGLTISQGPVVGSAMVFSGNYPGSGGFGHVGIVTSIGTNGFPIIKEMNAGRNGGGKGVYDTYQTTPFDTAYVEGYIVPPGSQQANPTTSATLTGASVSIPLPYPGGILNPLNAPFEITNAAVDASTGGGPDLNPVDWVKTAVSGILIPIEKMGEMLIGVVVLLVGLYFIAKDAGAPGVTNIIGKVPGIGTAIKVAA